MEAVLNALRALHDNILHRKQARAAEAREELYEGEGRARRHFFAAASDHADLERRQRSWERVDQPSWR